MLRHREADLARQRRAGAELAGSVAPRGRLAGAGGADAAAAAGRREAGPGPGRFRRRAQQPKLGRGEQQARVDLAQRLQVAVGAPAARRAPVSCLLAATDAGAALWRRAATTSALAVISHPGMTRRAASMTPRAESRPAPPQSAAAQRTGAHWSASCSPAPARWRRPRASAGTRPARTPRTANATRRPVRAAAPCASRNRTRPRPQIVACKLGAPRRQKYSLADVRALSDASSGRGAGGELKGGQERGKHKTCPQIDNDAWLTSPGSLGSRRWGAPALWPESPPRPSPPVRSPPACARREQVGALAGWRPPRAEANLAAKRGRTQSPSCPERGARTRRWARSSASNSP